MQEVLLPAGDAIALSVDGFVPFSPINRHHLWGSKSAIRERHTFGKHHTLKASSKGCRKITPPSRRVGEKLPQSLDYSSQTALVLRSRIPAAASFRFEEPFNLAHSRS